MKCDNIKNQLWRGDGHTQNSGRSRSHHNVLLPQSECRALNFGKSEANCTSKVVGLIMARRHNIEPIGGEIGLRKSSLLQSNDLEVSLLELLEQGNQLTNNMLLPGLHWITQGGDIEGGNMLGDW